MVIGKRILYKSGGVQVENGTLFKVCSLDDAMPVMGALKGGSFGKWRAEWCFGVDFGRMSEIIPGDNGKGW